MFYNIVRSCYNQSQVIRKKISWLIRPRCDSFFCIFTVIEKKRDNPKMNSEKLPFLAEQVNLVLAIDIELILSSKKHYKNFTTVIYICNVSNIVRSVQ